MSDVRIQSYTRMRYRETAVGCKDAVLWGMQLRGCRIWEYRAAGCGMHDRRMRDVGTREAGYG